MDKIVVFLNNMFLSLPRTEEMAELKSRLIENLTDKYEYLIGEGISEDEAFGKIVSEFGSIEELKREYGIKDEIMKKNNTSKEKYENSSLEFKEALKDLDTFKLKFGVLIAIGVVLCIIGLIGASYAETYQNEFLESIYFFVPVGIAVTIFIISGIRLGFLAEKVEKLAKIEGVEEFYEEGKITTDKSNNVYTGIIFLLATAIFLLCGFLFKSWYLAPVIYIIAIVINIIVGINLKNKEQ